MNRLLIALLSALIATCPTRLSSPKIPTMRSLPVDTLR